MYKNEESSFKMKAVFIALITLFSLTALQAQEEQYEALINLKGEEYLKERALFLQNKQYLEFLKTKTDPVSRALLFRAQNEALAQNFDSYIAKAEKRPISFEGGFESIFLQQQADAKESLLQDLKKYPHIAAEEFTPYSNMHLISQQRSNYLSVIFDLKLGNAFKDKVVDIYQNGTDLYFEHLIHASGFNNLAQVFRANSWSAFESIYSYQMTAPFFSKSEIEIFNAVKQKCNDSLDFILTSKHCSGDFKLAVINSLFLHKQAYDVAKKQAYKIPPVNFPKNLNQQFVYDLVKQKKEPWINAWFAYINSPLYDAHKKQYVKMENHSKEIADFIFETKKTAEYQKFMATKAKSPFFQGHKHTLFFFILNKQTRVDIYLNKEISIENK